MRHVLVGQCPYGPLYVFCNILAALIYHMMCAFLIFSSEQLFHQNSRQVFLAKPFSERIKILLVHCVGRGGGFSLKFSSYMIGEKNV